MGFNLDNYEDVHSRKSRFKAAFPSSRIITNVLYHDFVAGHILVETRIYLAYEDTEPSAVDIAFGERDTYPASMRKFYVEDTSTSSQGRAYDLVLETTHKPTKQNMERAIEPNKWEKRVAEKVPVEKPSDPWTIEQKPMPVDLDEALTQLNDGIKPEEIPMCKHGARVQKQGVGKTNKPFFGYVCAERERMNQCEPIWYVMDKSGRWIAPKPAVEQGAL
jgi:hypothetical protein